MRDQEAACDARVIAGRERGERALYASVIAGFAAGDNRLALAAPMACPMQCPMLGEKSIIHRLRSLSMSEVPTIRRRTGLAAIAAAALGLPLTASITYAAPKPPEPPASPAAPSAPLPQAPPVPDGEAPPLPPAPPAPPSAPHAIRSIDPDRFQGLSDEDRAEIESAMAEIEAGRVEREQAFAEMRSALAEAGRTRQAAFAEAARSRAEAIRDAREAVRAIPVVSTRAVCGGDEPVIESTLPDGRQAITICTDAIDGHALAGMREARREIAEEADFPAAQRDNVLRQLDRQIEQMERARSQRVSLRIDARPVVTRAVSYAVHAVVRSPDADGEDCAEVAAVSYSA